MFKSNHYYELTHKEMGSNNALKCIVKAISYNKHDGMWRVKILSIIESAYKFEPAPYYKGLTTSWYSRWCFDIREVTDAVELLTVVL